MFRDSRLEANDVSALIENRSAVVSIHRASPHRLAELVHHLSDAPVIEAHRAVRRTGETSDHEDPLSIVAAALLELRRDAQRYIGA